MTTFTEQIRICAPRDTVWAVLADIGFTLMEESDETLVTVSPTYELKFGILGRELNRRFVRNQYRKGMADLLAGLKRHVEQ